MNKFEVVSDFGEYKRAFLEQNEKLNLISKKEEQFLYEKHIFDSIAIKLFFEKYKIEQARILDIGCGGGFPCVPIAIEFPKMSVTGVDSIRKKINSVNEIKEKLNIGNLDLICSRAENLKDKYDIVLSRAVAELGKIIEYGFPLLQDKGYFVAYKSKKALAEIDSAKNILKRFDAKVVDIIEYTLPLEEIYERNLIVIKRNN